MELKNYIAQDDQGNVLPFATCYLYQRGSDSFASGLTKANGVALDNPFTADAQGRIQFAAPNGLYDLRVVSGNRDDRTSIQLNDVAEDVAAAKESAERAEAAMSNALLEAGAHNSVADGLRLTASGQKFQVLNPTDDDYLIVYLNQAGVAVEQARWPTKTLMESFSNLVKPMARTSPETVYMGISDQDGAQVAELTGKRFKTIPFDLSSEGTETIIGDREGAMVLFSDPTRTLVGPMEFRYTNQPGIFVTDPDGAVLNNFNKPELPDSYDQHKSPFVDGLLFQPVLATAANSDTVIYPAALLPQRELEPSVVASVWSTTTDVAVTGKALPISAVKFGRTAVLNFRDASSPDDCRFMTLTLKNVPVQAPVVPVKILFIGDSICHNQGAFLLNRYLVELGFAPTFIGTMTGLGSGSSDDGLLGEGRSGWESGDYTNNITDRALIISPGGEAAYLALSTLRKRDYNPFARAATGADPAAIVRNGYVFDPAFYQSRFSLATPDIVINALGTNDARDRSSAEVYAGLYANDILMHKQIAATWPTAKIIRTLPGTSLNKERNAVWTSHYSKIIRAMQRAAQDLANTRISIAPLWAMSNPEAGYTLPESDTGTDGFQTGTWSDPIHPLGSARHSYYKAMAPFVAAAALNI